MSAGEQQAERRRLPHGSTTITHWDDLPPLPSGVHDVILNDFERIRIGVNPGRLAVVVAYRVGSLPGMPKAIGRHVAQRPTFGEALRQALTLAGSELPVETVEWYVRALPWGVELP